MTRIRQQESRDPRGPTRTITGIQERSDITLLSLSCGHTGRANQIFHYKIGEECRCFDCGPHGHPDVLHVKASHADALLKAPNTGRID